MQLQDWATMEVRSGQYRVRARITFHSCQHKVHGRANHARHLGSRFTQAQQPSRCLNQFVFAPVHEGRKMRSDLWDCSGTEQERVQQFNGRTQGRGVFVLLAARIAASKQVLEGDQERNFVDRRKVGIIVAATRADIRKVSELCGGELVPVRLNRDAKITAYLGDLGPWPQEALNRRHKLLAGDLGAWWIRGLADRVPKQEPRQRTMRHTLAPERSGVVAHGLGGLFGFKHCEE
jgi:hypothetical protein